MNETIDERIVADIIAALEAIAPPVYRNSVAVEREKQTGNSPRDRLIVVLHGKPLPQAAAPLGWNEFVLEVGLIAYAIEPEQSGVPISARLSSLAADMQTALEQDLYRGGLACNTEFPEPAEYFTEQAPCSVGLVARVRYRTLFRNAYDQ